MIKKLKALLAGLALVAVSATASATVWTSTYDPNPDLTVPPSRTWIHDLTLSGFNPGTDSIDWFSLAVTVRDDGDRAWEFASVNLPGTLYDTTQPVFFGTILTAGIDLFGSLDFLNNDGKVSVTLSSACTGIFTCNAGDFIFDKSVLVASGSVPEPGALALVGLGLAGLAFARRRQQKQ